MQTSQRINRILPEELARAAGKFRFAGQIYSFCSADGSFMEEARAVTPFLPVVFLTSFLSHYTTKCRDGAAGGELAPSGGFVGRSSFFWRHLVVSRKILYDRS
jgi:hypothetical protein